MKKLLLTLGIGALALTASAVPSLPFSEMINGNNSTFENGTVGDWQRLNGEDPSVYSPGYNGSQYCLKLVNPSDNSSNDFWKSQVGLKLSEPLTTGSYVFKFYAKCETEGGTIQLAYQNLNSSSNGGYNTLNLTTEWTQYSVTWDITLTDIQRICINYAEKANTYYIDNIEFGALTPASEMNIDNWLEGNASNFEDNSLGKWTTWQSGSISISEPGYNSSYCLKLENTEAGSDFYTKQVFYTFDKNFSKEDYNLVRFWAKSDAATPVIQLAYQNSTGGNQGGYHEITLTNEWALYTWLFIPNYDDDSRLCINFGKNIGTYYIDNIEFGPVVEGSSVTFQIENGMDDFAIDNPYSLITIFNDTDSGLVPAESDNFTFNFTETTELRIYPQDSDEYEVVVSVEDVDLDAYTLSNEGFEWYLTLTPEAAGAKVIVKVYLAGSAPKEEVYVTTNFNLTVPSGSDITDPAQYVSVTYWDKVNIKEEVIEFDENFGSAYVISGTSFTLAPAEGYKLNVTSYTSEGSATISAPAEENGEWYISISESPANTFFSFFVEVDEAPIQAVATFNFTSQYFDYEGEEGIFGNAQEYVVVSPTDAVTFESEEDNEVSLPVNFTLSPVEGYMIYALTVKDAEGKDVAETAYSEYVTVTDGSYTFNLNENVAGYTFTLDIEPEGYSAINSIVNSEAGAAIYTLQGVKVAGNVNNLPKGIYIINGKKIAVR